MEQMLFALVRTLRSSGEDFEDLTAFLKTTLDQEQPLLYVCDRFSDCYMRLKIVSMLHKAIILELVDVRLPELSAKDNIRITATQLGEWSIQKVQIWDHSEYDHRVVSLVRTNFHRNSRNPSAFDAVSSQGDNANLPQALDAHRYTLICLVNDSRRKCVGPTGHSL